MATAQEHLDSLGITVQMAQDFIMVNLNNIGIIYQACYTYGITNDMITEILGINGLDGEFVSSFFSSNGYDGSALDGTSNSNNIQYTLQNGILTNTGSSNITITDVGIDMEGTISYSMFGHSDSITLDVEGTVENGMTVYMSSNSNGVETDFIAGEDFPDERIPAYAEFDLNNFLPDDMFDSFKDIPGASGQMTMEMALITTVGTFTDETTAYFLKGDIMTAQEHLSDLGVSCNDARDFIVNNLGDLNTIYNVCKQYGITNDMIAEIVEPIASGFSGTDVANFFASNGIDSTDLGGSGPTISIAIPTSGGNLDTNTMANNFTMSYLYENISLDAIGSFLSQGNFQNYKYADASTWNGVESLGYSDSGSESFSMNSINYVHDGGEANNYTNFIDGFDLADYSESNSLNLLQGQGIVEHSYDGVAIGNYDLAISWY